MLKKADHQNPLIASHDVFGAVAVVHIKVHNGHPFEAMALDGVFGRNGHVVEKAKPHGFDPERVVSRRTRGAKRVLQFAGQHRIGGIDGCACRKQGGFPSVGIDQSVGTERGVCGPACGHVFAQGIAQTPQSRHMHAPMGQLKVGQSSGARLTPLQSHVHTADEQPVFNGPQTLRALRVAWAHLVFPASGV